MIYQVKDIVITTKAVYPSFSNLKVNHKRFRHFISPVSKDEIAFLSSDQQQQSTTFKTNPKTKKKVIVRDIDDKKVKHQTFNEAASQGFLTDAQQQNFNKRNTQKPKSIKEVQSQQDDERRMNSHNFDWVQNARKKGSEYKQQKNKERMEDEKQRQLQLEQQQHSKLQLRKQQQAEFDQQKQDLDEKEQLAKDLEDLLVDLMLDERKSNSNDDLYQKHQIRNLQDVETRVKNCVSYEDIIEFAQQNWRQWAWNGYQLLDDNNIQIDSPSPQVAAFLLYQITRKVIDENGMQLSYRQQLSIGRQAVVQGLARCLRVSPITRVDDPNDANYVLEAFASPFSDQTYVIRNPKITNVTQEPLMVQNQDTGNGQGDNNRSLGPASDIAYNTTYYLSASKPPEQLFLYLGNQLHVNAIWSLGMLGGRLMFAEELQALLQALPMEWGSFLTERAPLTPFQISQVIKGMAKAHHFHHIIYYLEQMFVEAGGIKQVSPVILLDLLQSLASLGYTPKVLLNSIPETWSSTKQKQKEPILKKRPQLSSNNNGSIQNSNQNTQSESNANLENQTSSLAFQDQDSILNQISLQFLASLAWSYAFFGKEYLQSKQFEQIKDLILYKCDDILSLSQNNLRNLRKLYQAFLSYQYEVKQIDIKNLPKNQQKFLYQLSEIWHTDPFESEGFVSVTEDEITQILSSIGIIYESAEDSTGYQIDIAIKDTQQNIKLDQKIALEVDGPLHLSRSNHQPNGNTLLKQRHLELLGWKVVKVYYYEWEALQDPMQKQKFLLERIFGNSDIMDQNQVSTQIPL